MLKNLSLIKTQNIAKIVLFPTDNTLIFNYQKNKRPMHKVGNFHITELKMQIMNKVSFKTIPVSHSRLSQNVNVE